MRSSSCSLLTASAPAGGAADPVLARRLGRLLDELVSWAVPMINPDGVWAVLNDSKRSDRKNGRDNNGDGHIDSRDGVDLNRNHPYRWGSLGQKGSSSAGSSDYYRGPAAASEPEVQALLRLYASERQLGMLGDGERVQLAVAATAKQSARLLLLAGTPLNEPVCAYDPFVMNTQEQITEAIRDYQAGRMGQIAQDRNRHPFLLYNGTHDRQFPRPTPSLLCWREGRCSRLPGSRHRRGALCVLGLP